MTPAEIATIRQRLAVLEAELLEAGAYAVRADDIGAVPSAADQDEAPFKEMDQAIASSRNRARDDQLGRIADARRRLDADPEAFGLCVLCENEIPPRRLALLPFVRRCVACQSAADAPPGKPVRKKVMDYHD